MYATLAAVFPDLNHFFKIFINALYFSADLNNIAMFAKTNFCME